MKTDRFTTDVQNTEYTADPVLVDPHVTEYTRSLVPDLPDWLAEGQRIP